MYGGIRNLAGIRSADGGRHSGLCCCPTPSSRADDDGSTGWQIEETRLNLACELLKSQAKLKPMLWLQPTSHPLQLQRHAPPARRSRIQCIRKTALIESVFRPGRSVGTPPPPPKQNPRHLSARHTAQGKKLRQNLQQEAMSHSTESKDPSMMLDAWYSFCRFSNNGRIKRKTN